jgi:hypothetical protein
LLEVSDNQLRCSLNHEAICHVSSIKYEVRLCVAQ